MSESSPVRSALPLVGGLLACAACCSVPLLAPLVLSASAGASLLALVGQAETLGLVLLALSFAATLWQWRARARRSASDTACGCTPRDASRG